jgi:Single Cache domain 2
VAIGNPNAKQLIGQDERTLVDIKGKAFGQEQFVAATKPEGELTEVSYWFAKPGQDKTPAQKISYTT